MTTKDAGLRETIRRTIQDFPREHGLNYGELADAVLAQITTSVTTPTTTREAVARIVDPHALWDLAGVPGFPLSDHYVHVQEKALAKADAILALLPDSPALADGGDLFWLVLHEPRCVPVLKGPWPMDQQRNILREFMRANPTALIDFLTIGHNGPEIQHGPEWLQMLDGRSMGFARDHNARVAHAFAKEQREGEA